MDGSERCETCRFFQPKKFSPDDLEQGKCLRFPPVLDVSYILLASEQMSKPLNQSPVEIACDRSEDSCGWTFPRVLFEDWCGEYVAKEGGSDAAPTNRVE